MLRQTNPEIVKLSNQIDNCHLLARIIQRKIDENHPMEYLNSYIQPCGTVGCVLGDWLIVAGIRGDTNISNAAANFRDYDKHIPIFGFSDFYDCDIFGVSSFGTYQDRKELLNTHIDSLETKMQELLMEGVAA